MKSYLDLMRIKHWIKNCLIFIPIVCANSINLDNIIKAIFAFFAFSFMSSFVYIINDIRDIDRDRLHPRKKKRPLPSGVIKKEQAIIISIIVLMFSLLINVIICNSIFSASVIHLLGYLFVNILYSFGMKNVAILDVFLLSFGFILRVYYGAAIIDVEVSNWLFLTVLSASLFLSIGKRKKELINGTEVRKVLEEYNEAFLDRFLYLSLTLTLVFYSLWVIEQNGKYLFLTIPLLMGIFMKYSLLIEKNEEGDPTTILYSDKLLMGLCAIYGIVMLVLLLN